MLTKNGRLICAPNATRRSVTFKDFANTDSTVSSNNYSIMMNASNRRFYVGSGSTAPTSDDIKMDELINDLTLISSSVYPDDSHYPIYDDNYIMSAVAIYKNNTANDITVSEIGFGFYNTYSYTSDDKNVLFAREVLETPVTIEPNKSYSFSITIS